MCTSPDINITHCFYIYTLLYFLCCFHFFSSETISLVSRRNDDGNSIRRSGFIHGMQCVPVYDSPEEKSEDRRRLCLGEEREEDDLGSCNSSSFGRNSDVSGESSSDGEDSTEAEVQSQLKGPLDSIDALEEVLPMRRGISKFYNGISKSFTCLADAAAASSVKEFAKPEDPYNRKRKNLLAHRSLLDKNRNRPLRNSGNEISKRLANPNWSVVAAGNATSSSDLNSISSLPSSNLPPLHPQYKKSATIRSSSPTTRPNPPWRSLSLSDLFPQLLT